ncbi:hypothetical protein CsSME_00040399 [Camellia sinensis var. sinensis]
MVTQNLDISVILYLIHDFDITRLGLVEEIDSRGSDGTVLYQIIQPRDCRESTQGKNTRQIEN